MNIAFLIIGLIVTLILIRIASYQELICKNQVQQAKLLRELIDENK
tara:strand:+ start:532 stop:669 length:138 start_codon:yes stop_codon:yes gene_type:complete